MVAKFTVNKTATMASSDSGSWNFDQWLKDNQLQTLKQLFIDHKMCTVKDLRIDNKHFMGLMTDQRLLLNASMIPRIVSAIHNLQAMRLNNNNNNIYNNNNNKDDKKQNSMIEEENDIIKTIQEYQNNMDKFHGEFKQIQVRYQNKKMQDNEELTKYKEKNKEMEMIKSRINRSFDKLRNIINDQQQQLNDKINEYQYELNKIQSDQEEKIKLLDQKLAKTNNMIKEDKIWYGSQISKCQNSLKQNGGNNQQKRKERNAGISKNTKKIYDNHAQQINQSKTQIIKYVESETKSNDILDTKEYNINVKESYFDTFSKQIKTFIIMGDKDEIIDSEESKQENDDDNIELNENTKKEFIINRYFDKHNDKLFKLSNHNKTVSSIGANDGNYGYIIYGGSKGLLSGIYKWSIQYIRNGGYDYFTRSIGVTTRMNTEWVTKGVNCGWGTKWPDDDGGSYWDGYDNEWNKEETIDIILNLDLLIISYYKREKFSATVKLLKNDKLKPNQKYYFALFIDPYHKCGVFQSVLPN